MPHPVDAQKVPDFRAVWISDSQMKDVHDVTIDFGAPQAPEKGSSGRGLLREGQVLAHWCFCDSSMPGHTSELCACIEIWKKETGGKRISPVLL